MERNNIILNNIQADSKKITFNFSVSQKIDHFFNTNKLIVEYSDDLSGMPESILTIPFIGCLLAFAWVTNSVLWVNCIDKTFYDALPKIKRAYQDIYYYYPLLGRVVPSIISKNNYSRQNTSDNAVMLFSGGADCHASLIRNLHKHPTLFNIQGWYSNVNDYDEVAEADFNDIKTFALKQGLNFHFVKSNFANVINFNHFDKVYAKRLGDTMWHGFLHSMAFISIAAPFAFYSNIYEIIIASSLTTGLNHLCASNSTTDSEFVFASDGFTFHDGFELNRQNKIAIIASYQKQIGGDYFMRVCSFNDSNCCHCEKCFRTVLGLVAEGADPASFGFYHNGSLTQHWSNAINHNIALMSFASEKVIHWPHIKKRMLENYDNLNDEQREFVDWFLSFDFDAAKKKALLRYYRQNFFSILKRKIKARI